jgi:hypothetical protein
MAIDDITLDEVIQNLVFKGTLNEIKNMEKFLRRLPEDTFSSVPNFVVVGQYRYQFYYSSKKGIDISSGMPHTRRVNIRIPKDARRLDKNEAIFFIPSAFSDMMSPECPYYGGDTITFEYRNGIYVIYHTKEIIE